MPNKTYKIAVKTYKFGRPNTPSAITNITRFVKGFEVNLALRAPWETLSLDLVVPFSLQFSAKSPVPVLGDWLVVEDEAIGQAIFWGYVAKSGGSLKAMPQGHTVTGGVRVTVIGWLDFLGRHQIRRAPGTTRSQGGLLAPSEWDELFNALVEGTTASSVLTPEGETERRDIGAGLQEVVRVLGSVQLPGSIGGVGTVTKEVADRRGVDSVASGGPTDAQLIRLGLSRSVTRPLQLGDQIKVVHDGATSSQYAPEFVADPVPGWAIRGIRAFGMRKATAQQLITATFGGDPNMVELFPTLASPGAIADSEDGLDGGYRAGPDPFAASDEEGTNVFGPVDRSTGPTPEPKVETPKEFAPKLANKTSEVLQANPVLVYRVSPWRDESLADFVARNDTISNRRSKLDPAIFPGVTWRRGAVRVIPSDEVSFLNYEFTDANHVNCVTVGLPTQADSDIKWMQRSGLPLIAPTHPEYGGIVERRGLRVFEPDWPFFPPFEEDSSLMQSIFTVATQASQFMGAASRFAAGVVRSAYRSRLRPGMFVDVGLPSLQSPITLRAYVHTVKHKGTVGERGHVSIRTETMYSRGLFNEGRRTRGAHFVRYGDEQ